MEVVLAGNVDHLCLACETHLRGAPEALQHVDSAGHRENLARTGYVDKYTLDRVRKVKKWYFCEFCNFLMSTVATVALHVQEPRHKENRLSQTTERVGDAIVCGDVTIQEEAWHGLTDDSTCVVCNVEYEDKEAHKSESTHVINLIQSKIYAVNGNVYRKIDDSTFHCLTCNEVLPKINSHLDESKHKKILQNFIRTTRVHLKREDTKKEVCNTTADVRMEDEPQSAKKLELNSQVVKTQRNEIEEYKMNAKDNENASTSLLNMDENKIGKESKPSFSSPIIQNQENETKQNPETEAMKDLKEENFVKGIQQAVEEHGLTYYSDSNKVFCHTCNKRVPISIKNIKEHVNGESHKNNVRLTNRPKTTKKSKERQRKGTNDTPTTSAQKCDFKKVPLHIFTSNIRASPCNNYVIINNKYCVYDTYLNCLTEISTEQIRCQICEVNFPYKTQGLREHLQHRKHIRAMNEIPVLIRNDAEFIREIRSGIFQCGYCNIIDRWDGMENHLKSIEHIYEKLEASIILSFS